MSNFVINPYLFAEDLDVCFTEGESYDLGIGFNSGGDYTRFGVGQRIKTGSDYIGKTLTTASFYIRLVSGKTPSGTLTCTVIPTSGSGGSMIVYFVICHQVRGVVTRSNFYIKPQVILKIKILHMFKIYQVH